MRITSNAKIYELKSEQFGAYEMLRKIGYDNAELIFDKMVNFITLQHKNTGLPVAVVGASGGIDSSFVIAAAEKALGAENVKMVRLPYDGIKSSYGDSVRYAALLAGYLGIPESNVITIPIRNATEAWRDSIIGSGLSEPNQKQLGNAMARERMKILYHIADEYKGLVLDTCNNTEIKMGYLTKHGDGASDYNPVGDIYKVWIWEIARKLKLVPKEILEREPSADLIEGQNDVTDLGITYQALDLLLWLYFDIFEYPIIESKRSLLIEDYHFPAEIVDMVLSRVYANRHKSEPVPVLRICDRNGRKLYMDILQK